MPVIPPWQAVNPLDFIRAAQAGGALGAERAANSLRAAQIANEAAQSGGRIGLGYAELNQRAREAEAAQQVQRESAAARLKLAQQQQEAMSAYRQQLQENRLRDDERAERAMTQRGETAAANLGARESAAQALVDFRDRTLAQGDERLKLEQERIDKMGTGSKIQQVLAMAGLAPGVGAGNAVTGTALPPKDKLVRGQFYPPYGTWDGSGFVTPDEPGAGPAPSAPLRPPTVYMGDYLNSPDELEMLNIGAGDNQFPYTIPQP